jgi:hypothetical protein
MNRVDAEWLEAPVATRELDLLRVPDMVLDEIRKLPHRHRARRFPAEHLLGALFLKNSE